MSEGHQCPSLTLRARPDRSPRLADDTGRIQLYFRKDALGDAVFAVLAQFDLGDVVGVHGPLFRTRTGEVTVRVDRVELLAKSLRPLPYGKEEQVDGRTVRLQRIQPQGVTLPVYYDPLSLRGAEGGSLLLFLSFVDATDGSGGVSSAKATWLGEATRRDGSPVPIAPIEVDGVLRADLATVLGPAAGGSAGGMSLFLEDAGDATQLVYFAMSLDSFAAGYLLPAIED